MIISNPFKFNLSYRGSSREIYIALLRAVKDFLRSQEIYEPISDPMYYFLLTTIRSTLENLFVLTPDATEALNSNNIREITKKVTQILENLAI